MTGPRHRNQAPRPTLGRHALLTLALGTFFLASCSVDILHDLDEPTANTVLAALQKRGVSPEKERVTSSSKATYTIAVPHSDAPRAWQILREENLPRPKRPGLGEVFGNKQSLVPSSAEQQALLRYALAGEITRTLQSIDGVRKARVHVVIPRRDPLAAPDKKRPRPRAAILLEVAGKLSISSDEVRRLVAGSVEDLDKSAVEVVITPVKGSRAKPLAAPGALASVGPFRVAPGSRGGLLATLTSAVLLILILALTLVVFALRFRALRRLRAEETTSRRATSADIESSLSLLGQSFGRSQSRRPPS